MVNDWDYDLTNSSVLIVAPESVVLSNSFNFDDQWSGTSINKAVYLANPRCTTVSTSQPDSSISRRISDNGSSNPDECAAKYLKLLAHPCMAMRTHSVS